MIAATGFLAALLLPAVWFFVRAQPRTERVAALKRFNIVLVVVAFVAATGAAFYFWATTGHSIDSAWWPILAALGGALSICVVLIVGIIVRLVVFRQGTAP